MAPNPRVVKAFKAMKDIGISEDIVKPVLKGLFRLYERNWTLIEEENYRALADAIFDHLENKKGEHENNPEPTNDNNMVDDGRTPDEPRKTLKRLRLKYQDQAVSCSDRMLGDCGGSSSKRSKIDNSAGAEQQTSLSLVVQESPHLKEPKPEPGLDNCPQKMLPSSVMLIKPKDEPLVDDGNNGFMPTAVTPPGVPPNLNGSALKANGVKTCESQSRKSNCGGDGIRTTSADRTGLELTSASQDLCGSIDIASSSIGDIQILLQCNYVGKPGFHTPSLNSVLELVEDKCRNTYNIDCSFSMKKLMNDICHSCLELGSQSATKHQQPDSQRCNGEPVNASVSAEIANSDAVTAELSRDPAHPDGPSYPVLPDEFGLINDDRNEIFNGHDQDGSVMQDASPLKDPSNVVHSAQNGVTDCDKENDNSEEPNVVAADILPTDEPNAIFAGSMNPKFDIEDITKGQESVKISLINEVDNSPPPSFFYIPQNLKYQNACVNVLLARIGNNDCCSDCSGDCLTSKIPCVCAQETGGDFAYTSDGLVKESILEECVSMNRDPKKHCQFYCKDKECPLERPKSGDMAEPCKGHLVRKFIKECWSKCGCSRQCGNRLVQRGITRSLQFNAQCKVFMTSRGKGWGLRTLEDLPKGTFVCEYVGEILTNSELYERNLKSTLKQHAYPVLLDADWGSEKVLKDEEALCLDATFFGNVARFINHRCFDSNMVEIPVEVETPDRHYYHLAFFTTRDVAAMEELTWDYGIDFDDQEHPVKAFRCSCGSKFCRNIKRSRRRRIT